MRQLVLLLVNARSRVGGYNAGGGYRTTWLAVPVQRPNWSNVIRHRSSPALMSRSEKVRRPLQRPVQLPRSAVTQFAHDRNVDREDTASSSQAKTAGRLKLLWRKSIDCCNNSAGKSPIFWHFSQSIL